MNISMLEGILALLGAFILGAVLGSFVNALVWRLRTATTLWGRSKCPACTTVIQVRHLVPIVSWILLDGRCAECETHIGWQYPIVEFLGGVIVMFALARNFPFVDVTTVLQFSYESLFALTLLTLAVFDWRWKLLPVEFMGGAALFFGIWNAVVSQSILPFVVGAGFGMLFLGAQVLVSGGRWMGAGDPWLGALLGAGLGWPGIGVSFYITYLVGGLLVLVLLILGVVRRSERIPFAPLLAIGGIGALWFGDVIGAWFARAVGLA